MKFSMKLFIIIIISIIIYTHSALAQVQDCYPNCSVSISDIYDDRIPTFSGTCKGADILLQSFKDEDAKQFQLLKNQLCSARSGWIQVSDCEHGGPPPCCTYKGPNPPWEKASPEAALGKLINDWTKVRNDRAKQINSEIKDCRDAIDEKNKEKAEEYAEKQKEANEKRLEEEKERNEKLADENRKRMADAARRRQEEDAQRKDREKVIKDMQEQNQKNYDDAVKKAADALADLQSKFKNNPENATDQFVKDLEDKNGSATVLNDDQKQNLNENNFSGSTDQRIGNATEVDENSIIQAESAQSSELFNYSYQDEEKQYALTENQAEILTEAMPEDFKTSVSVASYGYNKYNEVKEKLSLVNETIKGNITERLYNQIFQSSSNETVAFINKNANAANFASQEGVNGVLEQINSSDGINEEEMSKKFKESQPVNYYIAKAKAWVADMNHHRDWTAKEVVVAAGAGFALSTYGAPLWLAMTIAARYGWTH